MNHHQAEELFVALARLSFPLERACEKAVDTVKDNEQVSDKDKEEIRKAVKNLFTGSLSLHHYLYKKFPEFDSIGESKERYDEIRKTYSEHLKD